MQMIKHLPQLGKVTQCSQTLCLGIHGRHQGLGNISNILLKEKIPNWGWQRREKKIMSTTVPASPVNKLFSLGTLMCEIIKDHSHCKVQFLHT